jgi:hypothetical protein
MGSTVPGFECVATGTPTNEPTNGMHDRSTFEIYPTDLIRCRWAGVAGACIQLGRIDLEPNSLASPIIDVRPPARRQRIYERESVTTLHQVLSRPCHRRSGVTISHSDPKASDVKGESQFQTRLRMANAIADELGHEQADRVREWSQTPFGEGRQSNATSFGGTRRHGR